MRSIRVFTTTLALIAFAGACLDSSGQSRVNSSGNGGMHTIQGRVFLPSGRTPDSSIKVELQSSVEGAMSVLTDVNGGFAFRSLTPGVYTITVNAGESFETLREYITIDTDASGNVPIRPTPKTFTVPLYLQLKRGVVLRNEVINAKWADIPDTTIKTFKHAVELEQAHKTAEAEAEFLKSIDLSPNFAPAHTELGKLYLQEGKTEKAVESFRSAIKYDDKDFDAHLNLGIAYISLKNYTESESELVTAAYTDRTAVTPHYYLGILFVMKGDLAVARKAFETARDLKGGTNLPAIHKYLGRIYMKQDMQKEALQELETYIKLAPKAQDADKVRKDISDIKAKTVKNAFV